MGCKERKTVIRDIKKGICCRAFKRTHKQRKFQSEEKQNK